MGESRNIGILAHVDTGKTTLTEAMLYKAGAIRILGRVDEGTAHTDDLPVERRRGITVRSVSCALTWKNTRIRIIDTPGHADFTAQVERALWALDAVVLMVSAVEGVQAHTKLLAEAVRSRHLPAILFLNKTDRNIARPSEVLAEIRRELFPTVFPLDENFLALPPEAPAPAEMYEALAETDDGLMERYLSEEPLPMGEALPLLIKAVREARVFPALRGSALAGKGIEPLLDAIITLLPPPVPGNGELSGIVFGTEENRQLGRAAHVRLFSGSLAPRTSLPFHGENAKISVIRSLSGEGDLSSAASGDAVAIYGLPNVRVGDVLGDPGLLPMPMRPGDLMVPLLKVRVDPAEPDQLAALRTALDELSAADPLLGVKWSSFTRCLEVQIMGMIQLEVLEQLLLENYRLKVVFGPPEVMYRETVSKEAEGFCAYTWPKPCWAVLKFLLTPLPRGSGVRYECKVPPSHMLPRYLKQVEQTLPLALRQGRLGWPVTDVLITLVDGQDHKFHTHPLDFVVATPWALHDGLNRAGSTLLEPMIDAVITLPGECANRLASLCVSLRGTLEGPETRGNEQTFTCRFPVAESLDLPVRLAALSGGRAVISTRFAGYRECPLELGKTAERRSIDPLDTSRYILAARSALDGGIFGEDW